MVVKKRTTLKKILIIIFSYILSIVIIFYFISYLHFHRRIENPTYSNGINAVWIQHSWVGISHPEMKYTNFANLLKKNKITDVFIHVGPLDAEGIIRERKYKYAKKLINELSKIYPKLTKQAWIGQVEKKGGGSLDLSDLKTRINIVKTAEKFINIGFNGIHYDIEPIHTNNKSFIDLLIRTHEITLRHNKILSIACPLLEPLYGLHFIVDLFPSGAIWTKKYYKEVSKYVD